MIADEHRTAHCRPLPKTGVHLHLALLGSLDRHGPWHMRPDIVTISPVGGADLDLTQATFAGDRLTLTKISLVGGVKLTVPADIDVRDVGFMLIGRRIIGPAPARPNGPTLRVRAYGIFGGVKVRRAA